MNCRPLATQPQRNFLDPTSPSPCHTPTIPCRPASRWPPPRTGTHSLLIHAPRPASRGNGTREASCVSRSILGARHGRTTVQSVSSALDRRARGFADTTVEFCACTPRSRAVRTVPVLGSNAAICYTASSRTVIEDTCESARPLVGVGFGMVTSRAISVGGGRLRACVGRSVITARVS